jgi:CheY-like chemotaxis protein
MFMMDCPPVLQGLRVVVTGSAIDTQSIAALMAECGALVRTTATTDEAFDLVQSDGCDVLVSDVTAPRRDGYHLMRTKRATPPAFSPRPRVSDPALTSAVQTFVIRPVDPEAMIQAVAALARVQ